ncbi:unnamed protein product [Cuscuta epithymum]|uniref:Small ribosomal subunit protein cS22 n=1 Tax=Cuscuta epithymum TaxID=186058 RepID=A0AAV0CU56_9ASTE|nr:unnamed protein product [Cuscuta epithymum]
MASISSSLLSPYFLQNPRMQNQPPSSKIASPTLKSDALGLALIRSPPARQYRDCLLRRRLNAVSEETSASSSQDPSSEPARRLYVGNIPRTVTNDKLRSFVEEYGAVEKAEVMYDKYSGRSRRFGFVTMKTIEEANAAIEKLNGTEVGGRKIKVNITESPLQSGDSSLQHADDSQFIDSPHKIYVGNLAKTVTTEILTKYFSEKGMKVVSAKVCRAPGTSKSSGYGFVTFSADNDVESAISSFNNTLLEGKKIRVNKA